MISALKKSFYLVPLLTSVTLLTACNSTEASNTESVGATASTAETSGTAVECDGSLEWCATADVPAEYRETTYSALTSALHDNQGPGSIEQSLRREPLVGSGQTTATDDAITYAMDWVVDSGLVDFQAKAVEYAKQATQTVEEHNGSAHDPKTYAYGPAEKQVRTGLTQAGFDQAHIDHAIAAVEREGVDWQANADGYAARAYSLGQLKKNLPAYMVETEGFTQSQADAAVAKLG